MSFIMKALGLSWPQFSPNDERVWSSYAPPTKSGTYVNPDRAMTIAAVHAAVYLLSYSVGMLPTHIFRHGSDARSKLIARDHPVDEVLSRAPNRWQTPMQWKSMMEAHRQLRGNAYSEIVDNADGLGFVDELVPRHPDHMRVEPTMRGDDIIYIYTDPKTGQERRIDPAKMFHLKGLSSDGFMGMSTIAYARESLGLAMATEEHGARSFGQGTMIRGILNHPGKLSADAAKRIGAEFAGMTAGIENTGRTVVLEEGMDWIQVGMSNEDAQFLESRKFQISEIARWFRVPPHMIGDLERATFSNIEHQGLELVTYTLLPLLVSWEQEISRSLIIRDDIYFPKFNVDALLRGDIESRYRAHAIGINGASRARMRCVRRKT